MASASTIIASHLFMSQSVQVKTATIQADYVKNNLSALVNVQNVQDTQINVPSFCDLLNSDCSNRVITQKVTQIWTKKAHFLNLKCHV